LGYGVIKSSKEVARGSVSKLFYPFREILLNRMRWRIMKGEFLETITTCASAKSHFIDVSLVYWKTFAHLHAEFIINTAKSLSRQHGATKNERTASSALMAFPFSQCHLSLDIPPSEVNQIKSSELAHQMDHETTLLNDLNGSMLA
jgi:hypothetical protein